jgi:catechol 2,3-dioxygenase-like lactoylglutathione lyase family enzyme
MTARRNPTVLDTFPVFAVLPSSDLERARAWYHDHLGMDPTKEDPGGLWYSCAGGTWFVVTRSAYAGSARNTAASFQVAGLDEVMAAMRGSGVVFEEYDLPDFTTTDGVFTWGPYRAAWFKDVDGNVIELSEVPAG